MAKMPSTVTVVTDNTKSVRAATKLLTEYEVLVGIPEDKGARNDTSESNAAIAYIQDQGSPARNIPARPFMQPGINNAMPQIEAQLQRAGRAAHNGDQAGVMAGLNGAGLAAQASIKKKIVDGPFAPLAPQTLAARRAKGRMQDKPLVDSGQLIRAVTYVVRKK